MKKLVRRIFTAALTLTVTLSAAAQLPFSETLCSKESFEKFTLIDANADNVKWKYGTSTTGSNITTSGTKAADDWLITPTLPVEAGKSYIVSFENRGYNGNYTEKLEVFGGYGATVADMTQSIKSVFDIKTNTFTKTEVTFTAPESGWYCIGFHALSPAKSKILYIKNIVVKEAPSGATPAAVSGFTAVPDVQNALNVNVSCVAPSLSINGEPLTALTKVEIKRGDAVVKTFENPAPGATLSFTDELTVSGKLYYTAVAYSADGQSDPATCNVYAGFVEPAAATGVKAYETANEGEICVEWTPVYADLNGAKFDPSRIKYVVAESYGGKWYMLSEQLPGTATSFTFQAVQPGEEQNSFALGVYAVTAEGKTVGKCGEPVFAGAPYVDFAESFANAEPHYNCATDAAGSNAAAVIGEEGKPFPSQDSDGGYLQFFGQSFDAYGAYISGKISLKDAANPGISLFAYYYDVAEDGPNTNLVTISVRENGGEWADVINAPINELAAGRTGWFNINASLAEYAGKNVQVRIKGTVKSYVSVLFDNIRVGSLLTKDLKALISAPAKAKAGTNFMVDVTVLNNGIAASNPFTVDLYADGSKVATLNHAAIGVSETATLQLPVAMNSVATEPLALYAVVNHEGEEYLADNTSATASVAPVHTLYPTPSALSANVTDNGVELTWTAPDLDASPKAVEESFENVAFNGGVATSVDGWTFVDNDGKTIGGIQNLDVPGITEGSDALSFFVWDTDQIAGSNDKLAAHTGSRYLASFFRTDDGQVDDWAISPRLSGAAQTVSFFAKSYSASYAEEIEVYYSTGSLITSDFVKVMNKTVVPEAWTEYSVQLPEGARYFAVRSCATGSFMLMLDDFKFTAASVLEGVDHLGYNVYFNGVKVNETPVANTSYLHSAAKGQHDYAVTAVYSKGESAPSNVATVDVTTGLDFVKEGITIRTEAHKVVIDGAEGKPVQIVTTDGRTLCSRIGEARTEISILPGLYIVNAGTVTAKVLVK